MKFFKKDEQSDDFINIKFNFYNLPIYHARKSVFSFIKNNTKYLKGRLLDVGCGKMPYKKFIIDNSEVTDYLGLDIDTAIIYDNNIKPDILWKNDKIPVEDASFDCVLLTEVLEHCPYPNIVLKEISRVLKDNGIVILTVPFIFPLHESPHDEYRYTPYCLKRLAMEAGFKDIEINALGGVNACLAQIFATYKNKYFKLFMTPLIYLLVKTDNPPKLLNDNVIFTRLSAVVRK